MQPTDARKVFPCFDEPAMKATFDVKIVHRRGTEALANSQLSGEFIKQQIRRLTALQGGPEVFLDV